jgi:excisionase family DNA binding protein
MNFETEGRLLNGIEVAQILHISRALAYRMMQKGEIKVVRFGKSVRVSESDLRTFIENHKRAQK